MLVGHIGEGDVDRHVDCLAEMTSVETIGLTDEPTHGNAVYGMTKAFFRHAYQKLCSATASMVVAPYNAQGKRQRGLPSSLTGE